MQYTRTYSPNSESTLWNGPTDAFFPSANMDGAKTYTFHEGMINSSFVTPIVSVSISAPISRHESFGNQSPLMHLLDAAEVLEQSPSIQRSPGTSRNVDLRSASVHSSDDSKVKEEKRDYKDAKFKDRRERNRQAAKDCRRRKKEHLIGMETSVTTLKEENRRLSVENGLLYQEVDRLRKQLASLVQH